MKIATGSLSDADKHKSLFMTLKDQKHLAVMKTLETAVTNFLKVALLHADTRGNHTLYFQACRQSLGIQVICMLRTELPVLYWYPLSISSSEPVA